jgi:hypothetical protein
MGRVDGWTKVRLSYARSRIYMRVGGIDSTRMGQHLAEDIVTGLVNNLAGGMTWLDLSIIG